MSGHPVYEAFTRLALPLARLYLKKRAKKQPEYLEHWDERFGWTAYPAPAGPRIWLHAVSVGETNAARPLVEQLLKHYPEAEMLLTCMTPTGRDAGMRIADKFPGRVRQCYLPYDTPELTGKFLDETRPTLGILMETEVWPNLLFQAKKRSIPMVLANARESEKSLRQAEHFRSLMSDAFSSFDKILAQSEQDKERIASIGGQNIVICGSVKFDIRPDKVQQERAREAKSSLKRPVLLIASTRQGEEKFFIDALACVPPETLVVLVPRHPQRFDEVAGELRATGISFERKSGLRDVSLVGRKTRVLLGDTMGEMSFNCALADVTVMGGSFGNFGSQNLIEPAAAGSPVILGPSTFNFAKPAADALAMGAAEQVEDAHQALALAVRILQDGSLPARREKAFSFAHSYTGATEKMIEEILPLWPL